MSKNTTVPKVRKALAAVRKKYGIGKRAFTKKDFFRICEAEEIRFLTPEIARDIPESEIAALKLLGGALIWNADLKLIYLRSFWSGRFRRFTAFHELGHYFLRHEGFSANGPIDYTEMERDLEHQADLFAALATSRRIKR